MGKQWKVRYGCESWTIKKAKHWRIDAFELWCWRKTLGSPLDCKEIQPVHPKGNQSWIFTGRTDAEAETPNTLATWCEELSPGKDPDTGKDWNQKKGMTEDEMVGWHHRLDGHEFEQGLRVGDGQGSLASCSPWGHKESDTTKQLNYILKSYWIKILNDLTKCLKYTLYALYFLIKPITK